MHRFFAEKEDISKKFIALHGSDVSHIRNVLRLKVGDQVEVLDGEGSLYLVTLADINTKSIKGEILSSEKINTESILMVYLGQSLIKGNGFDIILKKSVELGINSISPLITERTVVKSDSDKKFPRWKRIIEESSKQCGRSSIPKISNKITGLDIYCQKTKHSDLKLIFWEMEKNKGFSDINPKKIPRSASVLIGPEGGFTVKEVEIARSYGFFTVGLGPRIFRAETAPLVVLSLLQGKWGDIK